MKYGKVSLGLIPAFLAVSGAAHAQVIAFDVASGTVGNQNFGGSLGLDFDVVSSIQVTQLGFFDSGSNGITAGTTITVQLYDRNNTATPLSTQTFNNGAPGTLAPGSSFSFKGIPVITLAPGFQGRIVAFGFNAANPDGNTGIAHSWTRIDNTGLGAISFPSTGGFFNVGTGYPTGADTNTYLAGSFVFQRIVALTPEPGALALLGGLMIPGALLTYRRLRRKTA
jgi:hypothetical protein